MLEFTTHPARRRPLALVAVLVVLLLIDYVTMALYHDVLMALVMGVVFVGYLASFLFPSRYQFDERGITLRRLGVSHFFPWQRFRRYELDRGGLFLTSRRSSNHLDLVRGVYLVMDRPQQELVKPVLEQRIDTVVHEDDGRTTVSIRESAV
ncbi:MAG: hypothetical protein ACYCW6_20020 [Candidatus Xenobia bacterium]